MKRYPRLIAYSVFFCVLILAAAAVGLVFGRIDETVDAWGATAPASYTRISPAVSGIVREVRVREGGRVAAGDTLVLLAADEHRFQLAKSQFMLNKARLELADAEEEYENLTASEAFEISFVLADINAAERRMRLADTEYKRAEKLFQAGFLSAEEKERLELDYELRKSNYRILINRRAALEKKYQRRIDERRRSVHLASEAYDLAQQALTKTVITSPVSGAVLTSDLEDLVGSKAIEGDALMEIGDVSRVSFVAAVNEVDVPEVRQGQRARVYISAFPHRRYGIFEGKVTWIAPFPETTEGGTFFEVRIAIDEPWVDMPESRLPLRPGLSGEAKIVVKQEVRLITRLIDAIAQ